jgi:hypothetical protein
VARAKKFNAVLRPDALTGEFSVIITEDCRTDLFIKIMRQATEPLYQITGWTDHEIRLLFLLMGLSDAENVVQCSQGQLCEITGWYQSTMSVTVKGLIEKNLIAKVNPVGKSFWLMINPGYFCCVGDELRKFLMKRWDNLNPDAPSSPTERDVAAVQDAAAKLSTKRLRKAMKEIVSRPAGQSSKQEPPAEQVG